MSELREKLSQYIGFEPEEIYLPITDEDKQLFRELITGQEEMTDIVMNEYRFLQHYGHNYKGGSLIHIMWVYICTEKDVEKVLIEIPPSKILSRKVWEIIAKKYLTIFQPLIEIIKDQTPNSSSHKETNRDYELISSPEKLDNSITCVENTELRSLNHAIKVYQGAQIRQNWPNPFEIDFLNIKEPNDVATISCRIGQEPPDDYINKVIQVFSYGTGLGVGAFDDAVKANILKSKMSGKYAPVPAQHPAGTNIDTPTRFRAWLRHRYHELTLGTRQASLTKLTQEKFLPTDIPETYEERIRLLLLQTPNDNDDALAILWNHLPDELFSRMENAAPADIDAFFTDLKNIWLKRQPSTFTYNGNRNLSVITTNSSPIPYQLQPQEIKNRSFDHLDTNFIEDELYSRLGHANYNLRKEPFGQVREDNTRIITRASTSGAKKVYATNKPAKKPQKPTKVTYKCSNCGKIGHRKNKCPKLGKKPKKVNYTYQSEPENSDQEDEPIEVLEDEDEENDEEDEESITDTEPQNCFNIDFLNIKEPNDVATISCRIGDLIIPHAILDTGADDSLFTGNIPEYLGIKIDKKNVHKLTGAVGDSQSIGTSYNVPITIDSGEDSITVSEKEISVIPTKKDRNGNDISIMILGTKWQHHIGWDPIVKGEFIVTHNGKTITIPLSTHQCFML
ncbi:hypothetical protein Glove_368g55 [Diversispora epigaea]|uniref:CCHC-type domain-containing protein n=1 Tax=Diversispora epigaea TaxID=1348612 RepID=A0A397HB29_9GLOM|nr:hypothetical protein Glove_368g55 [Diversispora epigaea]